MHLFHVKEQSICVNVHVRMRAYVYVMSRQNSINQPFYFMHLNA